VKVDLSTRKGYLLACALRGPDLVYPKLKYILTGWLRQQFGVSYGDSVVRTKALSKTDILLAKGEVSCIFNTPDHHLAMYHWSEHVSLALKELGYEPGELWLASLAWLLGVMLRNPTHENRLNVHKCLDTITKLQEVRKSER